jgi:acetyl-CoA carboxylase biotin carboxyl carrier protein
MAAKKKSRSLKPGVESKVTSREPGALKLSGSPMDPGLLQQLFALMGEHDVTSLDVRDGVRRVSLKRGPQVVMGAPATYAAPTYATPAPAAVPSSGKAASSGSKGSGSADAGEDESGLVPIKSPMVGTFYAAPSPDAKPFVSVGSRVSEDTDVCVIEAMKVFNTIKAEKSGSIAKVCVTNGQAVEFGTVLFLVKV